MRGKILKIAVSLGRHIGSIGIRVRSWIEYQEWKYLNLEQNKQIMLPKDRMVSIRYDRKGSLLNVSFWQWVTLPDGKKTLEYLRETIKVPLQMQTSDETTDKVEQ